VCFLFFFFLFVLDKSREYTYIYTQYIALMVNSSLVVSVALLGLFHLGGLGCYLYRVVVDHPINWQAGY
jgi:hypothetical protein